MPLTESQKKMYIDRIAQAKKRIVDIQTRAKKDIAAEEKKIIEAQKILDKD